MIKTLLARVKILIALKKQTAYNIYLKLDELKDGDFLRNALINQGFLRIEQTDIKEVWCNPTKLVKAKNGYADTIVYHYNVEVDLFSSNCFYCPYRYFCKAYSKKEVHYV